MGNSESSSNDNSGMNDHCYNVGYEHGSMTSEPDIIGDAIEAFPCTLNDSSNRSYSEGYEHGMAGVSSGDSYESSSYPSDNSGNNDSHDYNRPTLHNHNINSIVDKSVKQVVKHDVNNLASVPISQTQIDNYCIPQGFKFE